VVAVAGDGRFAVEAIRNHRADLVFLDIQMPESDGFDVQLAVDPSSSGSLDGGSGLVRPHDETVRGRAPGSPLGQSLDGRSSGGIGETSTLCVDA
jgi:hypothetical protein